MNSKPNEGKIKGRYDSVTTLYCYGARYYDPSTGRFVTEDTYNGTVADPLTQNRYVCVADDPMRYTDPTGHVMAVPRYTTGGASQTAVSITVAISPAVLVVYGVAFVVPKFTVSISLNPEEETGIGKMEEYGPQFGVGVVVTAGATAETAFAWLGCAFGDPACALDSYSASNDFAQGTQMLATSGPGFLSGLGQFVNGVLEGLPPVWL